MLKNLLENSLKPTSDPGARGLLPPGLRPPPPILHCSFLAVDEHLSVGCLYNLLCTCIFGLFLPSRAVRSVSLPRTGENELLLLFV